MVDFERTHRAKSGSSFPVPSALPQPVGSLPFFRSSLTSLLLSLTYYITTRQSYVVRSRVPVQQPRPNKEKHIPDGISFISTALLHPVQCSPLDSHKYTVRSIADTMARGVRFTALSIHYRLIQNVQSTSGHRLVEGWTSG